MNVAVWIVSGLLAAMFLMAGAMKLTTTREKLDADPRMGWSAAFPMGTIRFIGATEVAGAAGLILPWAFNVAPVLTPLAGVGLAIIMGLAALTHLRRGEGQLTVTNLVFLALAVFVAVARF